MHCWYLTPEKLSKMYKEISNKCWKCNQDEGASYHVWWTCKKEKSFGNQIRGLIQKILKM